MESDSRVDIRVAPERTTRVRQSSILSKFDRYLRCTVREQLHWLPASPSALTLNRAHFYATRHPAIFRNRAIQYTQHSVYRSRLRSADGSVRTGIDCRYTDVRLSRSLDREHGIVFPCFPYIYGMRSDDGPRIEAIPW